MHKFEWGTLDFKIHVFHISVLIGKVLCIYKKLSRWDRVLIVVNFHVFFSSGSVKGQTLHLTKITIRHVLMTLNPYDYFTAFWYNSKQGFVMQDCSNGTFIPATSRNKRVSAFHFWVLVPQRFPCFLVTFNNAGQN